MSHIKPEQSRAARTLALLALSAAILPAANMIQSVHADTAFPQTGYSIWGPFELYWQTHGGVEQFGLPRTSVYPAGNKYDAQWFERAVFTFDPSKPDPYKVELNLLGSQITASRSNEAPFKPAQPSENTTYFAETKHNLAGKLRDYWQSTGGLAIYGFPISEAFTETSKSDGKTYTVQYFERNRLELHPEAAGTKYEVQLGLLGSELLDAQGGPAAIGKMGSGKFYPPQSGYNIPPGGMVDSPNAGTPEPVDNTIPAAPALPATNKTILLSADFSTAADLNNWQATPAYNPPDTNAASWNVKDGMLHQSGIAGEEDASPDALLLTKSTNAADLTLEAQIFPGGGESLGLVVRWTPTGYYLARLYTTSPNTLPKAQIVKVTPTSQQVIGQSTNWPGYTPRQWRDVAFTAKGSALTLTVDGVKIAEANDTQLTSGKFGFYAYADGTAYFDNLRVTQP